VCVCVCVSEWPVADRVERYFISAGRTQASTQSCRPIYYTLCFKKRAPFCFCYNFVSRDRILVIFGSLAAKEIFNRTLLTDLKDIAGALR